VLKTLPLILRIVDTQSSATIDWWEQDWNEVMMYRLLKLSETKQNQHVHLGDVSDSTHGKYDVRTVTRTLAVVVLCVFSLLRNILDICSIVLVFLFYSVNALFTLILCFAMFFLSQIAIADLSVFVRLMFCNCTMLLWSHILLSQSLCRYGFYKIPGGILRHVIDAFH